MEALSELIQLVTQKRIKKVELFDENSRNKSSNYYKLFDGIHSKKYLDDQDAAEDIYQCDPSAKKYLILKTRLKQKLLNTLFFLDFNKGEDVTEQDIARHECSKSLYYAKILLFNKNASLAIPVIEKTYKRAQEMELTAIEFECANILREYFFEENLYKDFINFRSISEKIEKKLYAENNTQKYFQELWATYRRSKNNHEEVRQLSNKYAEIVKGYVQEFNTKLLQDYFFKINMLCHRLNEDYKAVQKTINRQEIYYDNAQEFYPKSASEELQIQMMNSFLHLKDYEGSQTYLNNRHIIPQGTPNWYKLQEYRYLIAMHKGWYVPAAEIFKDTLQQSNFRNIAPEEKLRWKTFQAYLHYFYKSTKMKDLRSLIQNSKIDFKLSDYIDDRPPFSKENRSLNLSILVSQILFYVDRLDFDGIKDCIQALNPYCRRYPKKDINFRSECFIYLLKEMVSEDFKFYQTRKNTEKIFKEMSQTPLEYDSEGNGLEVIPYEVAWERILENLKNYCYG